MVIIENIHLLKILIKVDKCKYDICFELLYLLAIWMMSFQHWPYQWASGVNEELDTGGRKVSVECWLPRLDSTEPISDVQKFGWFG